VGIVSATDKDGTQPTYQITSGNQNGKSHYTLLVFSVEL